MKQTRDWWRHARVGKKFDGRIKLTDSDKKEIRDLYESNVPIREIARQFHDQCSRRTIQFVLFPERKKIAADQFKERRADGRYKESTEQRRETMRKHRGKIRALKANGLIE